MNNFIAFVSSTFQSEIPLADVLAIGQVLFLVVIAGIVGFHVERSKHVKKTEVEVEEKARNHQSR
jgi:hypothetical protein